MNALKWAFAELIGLFVEDRFLALGLALVVAAAAILAALTNTMLAGATLLFGSVAVLIASLR